MDGIDELTPYCPKCRTPLRQLGHLEEQYKTNGRIIEWKAENLWNCPTCKFPQDVKIYRLTPGGPAPFNLAQGAL